MRPSMVSFEKLDATTRKAPAGFTSSGAVSLLAPSATDSGSLTVAMNTAAAGAKNGSVTLNFTPTAWNKRLRHVAAHAQSVNVSGTVVITLHNRKSLIPAGAGEL